MSTATELMRRALDYIDQYDPQGLEVYEEIEVYLAAEPAEPAEPSGDYVLGEGSPYYTEREPAARKPMSEEEILELYNQCEEETSVHSTIFHFDKFARAIEARGIVLHPLNRNQIEKAFDETGYLKGDSRGACFVAGVRFAEKHHGIGGDDD